jgi:hypothetical protein
MTAEPDYVPGSIPSERWQADERAVGAFAAFRDSIASALENSGLLCLAESCNDILMWGHYANAHRGICIGFQRDHSTVFGRQVRPVSYQRDYPRLTVVNFDPTVDPHSADQLWLTKAANWSYEREWRILMPQGDCLYTIDAPVTTIVFGARISDPDRQRVLEAVGTGRHSPVFQQAIPSQNRFELQLENWQAQAC